jgi:shikimate kinase
MNSKENLVFLGMMGSGKSSIGSLVSKKLNINFIDVDIEIEKKLDLKISEIFENKGEKYFRQIEEAETLKALRNKKTAISLGGGAFLNNKIKKEVLENHISFWLNWDVKTLVNRIKDSKKRPIAHKSSKKEIEELIEKRSIIYSKAMYKINCENLIKNEIVKKIIKIYETY